MEQSGAVLSCEAAARVKHLGSTGAKKWRSDEPHLLHA